MMKAGVFTRYGPINEALKLEDSYPKPKAKTGEALVRVHASSVNPVDWKILEGWLYIREVAESKVKFPFVGGKDLSGTIVSFADDVTAARAKAEFNLKVGDDVFSTLEPLQVGSGAYAEYAAVRIDVLVSKPRNLSHIEAAVMPLVYLTSYQALFDIGKLTRGQKVLIIGGTGGTGLAGVQLANNAGAKVTVTCRGCNKALLISNGADEVIDYKNSDWAALLKGAEFDLVYDTVGERDAYMRSAQVLKHGGHFVTNIGSKGDDTSAPEAKNIDFTFHLVGGNRVNLQTIRNGAESGVFIPKIHKVYRLDDLSRAMQESKAGHVIGKIAIQIASPLNIDRDRKPI